MSKLVVPDSEVVFYRDGVGVKNSSFMLSACKGVGGTAGLSPLLVTWG